MLIREAMTKDPRCCTESDDGSVAAQIFWENDCGCVPLVDDQGRLTGMVTDRDLCMAAHFSGLPLKQLRLGDLVQSAALQTCRPEQALEDAAELMKRHQIRRVPVVGADRRLVGILSLNDIAVARRHGGRIPAEAVADTLGAICERRPARAA